MRKKKTKTKTQPTSSITSKKQKIVTSRVWHSPLAPNFAPEAPHRRYVSPESPLALLLDPAVASHVTNLPAREADVGATVESRDGGVVVVVDVTAAVAITPNRRRALAVDSGLGRPRSAAGSIGDVEEFLGQAAMEDGSGVAGEVAMHNARGPGLPFQTFDRLNHALDAIVEHLARTTLVRRELDDVVSALKTV